MLLTCALPPHMQELREENHKLVQQTRVLGAAVRELQQQIEDLTPTDEMKRDVDSKVQQAMADTVRTLISTVELHFPPAHTTRSSTPPADLRVGAALCVAQEASSLERKLQGELDQARRTLEEVQHQLTSEKERHVGNAEKLRKQIMDLQQQNEDLKVRARRGPRASSEHGSPVP